MDLDKVIESLRPVVTPSSDLRENINRIVSEVLNRLKKVSKGFEIKPDIEVHGSYAHDTWLPDERDIDIFLIFERSLGRNTIVKLGLEISKRAFPIHEEYYAEHPYIRVAYKGCNFDIVPAAKIKKPDERITAADRTPLHTEFLKKHLTDENKFQIRVLKKLLRNLRLYGAEIRIKGFSGYLTELLVLYYGSLKELFRAASKEWKPYRTVLSFHKGIRTRFNDPLVVIDPIDPNRNVAAALSLENMCKFIMVSRKLLEKPSTKYFYPPEVRSIELNDLNKLRRRGTHLISVRVKCPEVPPDTLWGEIWKSMEGLKSLLERYGFQVIDSLAWSDERRVLIFVYEYSPRKLSELIFRKGPPVWMENQVNEFMKKHLGKPIWIRGDRVYTLEKRGVVKPEQLLKDKYKEASLSKHIAEVLHGAKISTGKDVILKNKDVPDFLKELKLFVEKKEWWLD